MKQYKYKINGAQYDVTIDSISGNLAKVEVNGIPFEVEMQGSSLVEEDLPTQTASTAAVATINNDVIDGAVSALVMLGFPTAATNKVVQAIVKSEPQATIEQVIKLALKQL